MNRNNAMVAGRRTAQSAALAFALLVAHLQWCSPQGTASDLQPIELASYRIDIRLQSDWPLDASSTASWEAGLRESLLATAGRLWKLESIAFVSEEEARFPKQAPRGIDKSFRCHLTTGVDGRRVVRVTMRDWLIGPAADQVAAMTVEDGSSLVSASLAAIVASFGARGEVAAGSEGVVRLRVQGAALPAPSRQRSPLAKGAFGQFVSAGATDRVRGRVCGVVTEVGVTQTQIEVLSSLSSASLQAWSSGQRVWCLEQIAATAGSWVRVHATGLPSAGLTVTAEPLHGPKIVQVFGRTDREGLRWVPRQDRPVWLQLRFAGIVVVQRPAWPGAVESIEFEVQFSDEQVRAVRLLAQARLAIEQASVEAAAWRAKAERQRKEGNPQSAASLRYVQKVADDTIGAWEGKLQQLNREAMPEETAVSWNAQCERLQTLLRELREPAATLTPDAS